MIIQSNKLFGHNGILNYKYFYGIFRVVHFFLINNIEFKIHGNNKLKNIKLIRSAVFAII